MPAPGLLLVDKPAGLTSHDVVSRARKALGTRKIGHAGTLDPMATGLLVLGVEAATRLLTFVVGADKTYTATIRLGASTDTDDAEGAVIARADPSRLAAVDDREVDGGIAALTGRIAQVPSSVSAIKVAGRRAYDLARAGETVELAAREVTIARFEVLARRRDADSIDLDVVVDCSSGTYIRALARDLGDALGVGGHLTALRRTRIGPFALTAAVAVDAIDEERMLPPADAATALLETLRVTADEARDLRHGKRLAGAAGRLTTDRAAAIDPTGHLVGIVEARGGAVKSAMNMPEEQHA
jgi:tRNA pseudouridine55 synthase